MLSVIMRPFCDIGVLHAVAFFGLSVLKLCFSLNEINGLSYQVSSLYFFKGNQYYLTKNKSGIG